MDRLNGIDLEKYKVIEAEGLKIGVAHGEVYEDAHGHHAVKAEVLPKQLPPIRFPSLAYPSYPK